MIIAWLITLVALTLTAAALASVIKHGRDGSTPPRSHARDPQFRSPMQVGIN